MEELARRLGTNIRRARVVRGLTQEEVAQRIDLPLELYERMETGTYLPSIETFTTLYYVLDVPMDELLGSASRPHLRLVRGDLE